MKKYILPIIGITNALLAVFLVVEFIFFFNGPIIQLFVHHFRNDLNPNPVQLYLFLIFGFSLFSIYGFLNSGKHDILIPDMWKNWLVFLFFVCSIALFVNEFTDIEAFQDLFKEDHFFENMTFVLYIFAAVFFLKIFFLIKDKASVFSKIFIIFFAISCFLIGMEEISWGQRVFGWQTPKAWGEINFQNETTLHNLESSRWIHRGGKIFIVFSLSMIMGFSLYLKNYLQRFNLEFLVPNQKFFLFAFIFPIFHSWDEFNEFNLSLFFAFYSYSVLLCVRESQGVSRSPILQGVGFQPVKNLYLRVSSVRSFFGF